LTELIGLLGEGIDEVYFVDKLILISPVFAIVGCASPTKYSRFQPTLGNVHKNTADSSFNGRQCPPCIDWVKKSGAGHD
jgi:hypothetical protein